MVNYCLFVFRIMVENSSTLIPRHENNAQSPPSNQQYQISIPTMTTLPLPLTVIQQNTELVLPHLGFINSSILRPASNYAIVPVNHGPIQDISTQEQNIIQESPVRTVDMHPLTEPTESINQ